MTTVLLVEKEQPAVNLMEWGLREEGYDVIVATDPDEPHLVPVTPEVVVFNTHIAADEKRLWVSAFRFLAPHVAVVDLVPPGITSRDTGADAYLHPPYPMSELVRLIVGFAAARDARGATVS